MKINRRNTLIGLGTIVAGGGAALGTGAFSTVEADRSVDVSTEGDGDALLELEIDSETLSGDDDLIEFDLDNLNEDATTTFDDALVIGYDGEETNVEYSIDIEDEDTGDGLLNNGEHAMYFEGDEDPELTDSTDVTLDVVFDLRNNDEEDIPEDVSISATDETGE
ncbi:hypothetical protein QA600_15475 [Natronococcus sp. A-GB1]|uniref:hypothetical protein n=1 Tax=Natronococcus sp. A-GB1 TaxID=3037648 RepID=UPI00241C382A|nr:hypothetical protein [Natronococcus sp. A-GB1]MDG5760737.1 hypothetical protein [Natronococcus sp. A-GB1]